MARFSVLVGSDFAILPVRGDASARSSLTPLPSMVDGFLTEEHTLRLSKTSYPVESGQSLTDHAVVEPRTLKLEGWVSDLLAPAGETDATSRGLEAWQRITELMESRKPILVVTTLGVYEDMLITSVKAPVDRTTGRALRFEMELEEVLFRALERGTRPPPVRIGPAEDRSAEIDRGRVSSPGLRPLAIIESEIRPDLRPLAVIEGEVAQAVEMEAILAAIRAEIASGLSEEPSLWDRTLNVLGASATVALTPFR